MTMRYCTVRDTLTIHACTTPHHSPVQQDLPPSQQAVLRDVAPAVTIGFGTTSSIGLGATSSIGSSVTRSIGSSVTRSIGSSVTSSIGSSVTRSIGLGATRSIGSSVTRSIWSSVTRSIGSSVTRSERYSLLPQCQINYCLNLTYPYIQSRTVADSLILTRTVAHRCWYSGANRIQSPNGPCNTTCVMRCCIDAACADPYHLRVHSHVPNLRVPVQVPSWAPGSPRVGAALLQPRVGVRVKRRISGTALAA